LGSLIHDFLVSSAPQSFEPPSTRTVSPVTHRASSDARKATTGALSSGRARRWIACMSGTSASSIFRCGRRGR
jgi:hypothetical protein